MRCVFLIFKDGNYYGFDACIYQNMRKKLKAQHDKKQQNQKNNDKTKTEKKGNSQKKEENVIIDDLETLLESFFIDQLAQTSWFGKTTFLSNLSDLTDDEKAQE